MVTDIAYDHEASQMIISFTMNPAPTQPTVSIATFTAAAAVV